MSTCHLKSFCYVCGENIPIGIITYKSEKFNQIYASFFDNTVIEENWVPSTLLKMLQ